LNQSFHDQTFLDLFFSILNSNEFDSRHTRYITLINNIISRYIIYKNDQGINVILTNLAKNHSLDIILMPSTIMNITHYAFNKKATKKEALIRNIAQLSKQKKLDYLTIITGLQKHYIKLETKFKKVSATPNFIMNKTMHSNPTINEIHAYNLYIEEKTIDYLKTIDPTHYNILYTIPELEYYKVQTEKNTLLSSEILKNNLNNNKKTVNELIMLITSLTTQ
jgi:hypothetical protein